MNLISQSNPENPLSESEVEAVSAAGLERLPLTGKRLLVIIPDHTRTMPLPLFFRLLSRHLLGKTAALDFLVALGTHPPLSQDELLHLVGITPQEKAASYPGVNLFNHAWKDH